VTVMSVTDRKVILLIIDNPDDVTLIQRTLMRSRIAHDLVLARDGAEALDYLFGSGSGHPLPAAIVLDLKLPRVDGAEVLQRLRTDERTRHLPVLIFSSPGEVSTLTRGNDSDLRNLRAAVDFAQFREAVRQLGAALSRGS
jgi:two-component system response regulator